MLGRWTYLAILAGCLLVTLPLELLLHARVYARPRRWLSALLPVFAVCVLWDWVAIRRGHWSYSDRFTTGAAPLGVPVEELLFFLVVPTCAILTYQAVHRLVSRPAGRRAGRPGGRQPAGDHGGTAP